LAVLRTTVQFALQKWGLAHFEIFNGNGRRLTTSFENYYAHGTTAAAGEAAKR